MGRLAVCTGGFPHIVPVNFALDGDAIVFRTDAGTPKLVGTGRSAVAFEVDGIDTATRSGWSVVVHGLAQEITAADRPDVIERIEQLALRPWVTSKAPHTLRILPTDVSGRRVRQLAEAGQ